MAADKSVYFRDAMFHAIRAVNELKAALRYLSKFEEDERESE